MKPNRSIPAATVVPVLIYPDLRAKITMEPTDFEYGQRQYHATDLAGHQWTFSETLADMAPEQWGGETVD